MPDYSLGKIYMVYPKVEDPDDGDVYYGSTTNTLARRMALHRSQSCCKILFDKYGVKNCFIELVQEYPCESKDELNKKEGEYIRANKCINKRIAGRTQKEYDIDNKDKKSEYQKQHYVENRDKISEQQKQYNMDNRDKIKQYYIVHIDKIKEQQKQYYIKNRDKNRDKYRDKILEKQKQKANCPHCNKEMTKNNMTRHIRLVCSRNLPQLVHTTAQELD